MDNKRYSKEPPVIPIGTDAYVHWDMLPYQKLNVRAYMKSTYDRSGFNKGANGGFYLYQESDTFNAVMDERGSGCLYFVRSNHFHGSPWHYEVDGEDFILKESGTDDPVDAPSKNPDPHFIPEELFPAPLNQTWNRSAGGDLMQTPIPFESSLRFALSRTFYGTAYGILHKYPKGFKNTTRPLASWDRKAPDPKAVKLLKRAGGDIAPEECRVAAEGRLSLAEEETAGFVTLAQGPCMIRALSFSVPEEAAYAFGKAFLRVTWDNSTHASVDAPISMFFGVGHLFNKDGYEYLHRGLMSHIRYREGRVWLNCYWPMPFFENAAFELLNHSGEAIPDITYTIRTLPYDGPRNHVAYFHATYTDIPQPVEGEYNVMLDTRKAEGGGEWCGSFVGLTYVVTHSGRLMPTVEGDQHFFFDDSNTPQAQGTGTEEFAGGGDHWRWGTRSTLPLYGHPVGRMGGKKEDNPLELLNSAYRYLVADCFPFGKNAVIAMEHGIINNSREHYEGCAYWYGVHDAGLVLTDEVIVCDEANMRAHRAQSERAQAPYELTSRYDWGPHEDFPMQREYFPAQSDRVRNTLGTTEFDVALDPDNIGLMLRKKFDYFVNNQCAKVYVKRAGQDWAYAGEWYIPGSSTTVFSRPEGKSFTQDEMKPTEHHVVECERRWREEEFLIDRSLTEGADKVRLRFVFEPVERELFPGYPYPGQNAWSECRYWVYNYRMPGAILP